MWLSRLLLCLGAAAGTLSMLDTLAHAWDPAFQAPALPLGPTHTNYHAFREFTLAAGAVAVMLYVAFRPPGARSRPLWVVLLLTSACYYGGWWLPGPLLGLTAPNRVAAGVHLAATVLSLSGVALAWRHFPGAGPATFRADLAVWVGFASLSHVTEAFRRLTGTSHARWRSDHSGAELR